jgi:Protein of unknown function (DUF1161)
MKPTLILAAVLFVPFSTHAQAAKPCEDLKSEIAQKLDAKGVKSYTLDVVAKDADAGDGKVVGTCEGGTKKILYRRGDASTQAAATDSKKQ